MEGYVKLYRQLMLSPVFENEKLLKVWIWCLLKATHADHKTLDGLTEVNLAPGQFGIGMVKASTELNMPRTTAGRYLKALERNGMITVKVGTKKTFITVENWDVYQCNEADGGHKTDIKRTESGQKADTYKNGKNGKNGKNIIYIPAFEVLWRCYPRKVGKSKAYEAYQKVISMGISDETLLNAVKAYAAAMADKEERFIKHMTTWLNQRGWEDEYEQPKQRKIY